MVVGLLGGAIAENPLYEPVVGVEELVYCAGIVCGGILGMLLGEEAWVVEEWVGVVGDERCGWEVVGFDLDHDESWITGCVYEMEPLVDDVRLDLPFCRRSYISMTVVGLGVREVACSGSSCLFGLERRGCSRSWLRCHSVSCTSSLV